MTLEQFWAEQPGPLSTPGSVPPVGTESEWLDWCDFTLRGPAFLIVDAAFAPSEDDGLRVRCLPGTYHLQVRVMSYGGDRRFSRLRAVRMGAAPTVGGPVGETWTDTARTGICDLKVFREAWGDDDDASGEKLSTALETEADFGVAEFDPGTGAVLPFLTSGFGDGTYEVHALVEGDRPVGFEVEFIAPGEPYPFAVTPDDEGATQVRHAVVPRALSGGLPGKGAGAGGSTPDFLQMLASALGGSAAGGKGGGEELKDALRSMQEQARSQVEAATAGWRDHLVQVRRSAPPRQITIEPAADDAWLASVPEAAHARATLQQQGFALAGVFAVVGQAGMRFAGLAHPARRLHATLIQAGKRLFTGLVRRGVDGVIEEVTNLPAGTTPLPDWIRRTHAPSASVASLLARLGLELPPEHWLPADAENFVPLSEEDYARHHAWLAERGGRTASEIRAGLEAAGKLPPGDEGEELVRMSWNDEVEKSLWNWLKGQRALPFELETVIDRLVVIYDGEPPDLLANAYWSATGDYSIKEREFAEGPAGRAFERIVEARKRKLRKVLTKRTPLAADFWLPD